MIRKFPVDNTIKNTRLDVFLAQKLPELSRSFLQKLIKNGSVKLNDQLIVSAKFPLPANGNIYIDKEDIE